MIRIKLKFVAIAILSLVVIFTIFFLTNTSLNKDTELKINSDFSLEKPLKGGEIIEDGYRFVYDRPDELANNVVIKSPEGNLVAIPNKVGIKIDIDSIVYLFERAEPWKGPKLSGFLMPFHPLTRDIIFISTSEFLNENYTRNINKIYSYNLKTFNLKQLYYEINKENSPKLKSFNGYHFARALRPVGVDGSKVIFLISDPEDSPGPCFNKWYHYKDRMEYLELADLEAGLKSYIVSEDKLKEVEQAETRCISGL